MGFIGIWSSNLLFLEFLTSITYSLRFLSFFIFLNYLLDIFVSSSPLINMLTLLEYLFTIYCLVSAMLSIIDSSVKLFFNNEDGCLADAAWPMPGWPYLDSFFG